METKRYRLKSGNILEMQQDEFCESPDSWGNEDVFLVYDHRDFTIKREGFEPKEIFEYSQKISNNEPLENNYNYDEYHIFPVDAYIHSGVHLSLANTKDYPDRRWDVSTTGYVLVKGKNELMQGIEFVTEDMAKERAKGLIETWNQYLSGDVWGFRVLKRYREYSITEKDLDELASYTETPDLNQDSNINNVIFIDEFLNKAAIAIKDEEIDSCWGFYGDDPRTNGILDDIDDEIIEEIEDETHV